MEAEGQLKFPSYNEWHAMLRVSMFLWVNNKFPLTVLHFYFRVEAFVTVYSLSLRQEPARFTAPVSAN